MGFGIGAEGISQENKVVRSAQFWRESSSGRAVAEMPSVASFFAIIDLSSSLGNVLTSILRLCPNAARARVKNSSCPIAFLVKKSSEMSDITMIAESIFGFGEKQLAGTILIIRGVPNACTPSAKRFILLEVRPDLIGAADACGVLLLTGFMCGGAATMRSATSFWIVSAIILGLVGDSSRSRISRPVR